MPGVKQIKTMRSLSAQVNLTLRYVLAKAAAGLAGRFKTSSRVLWQLLRPQKRTLISYPTRDILVLEKSRVRQRWTKRG